MRFTLALCAGMDKEEKYLWAAKQFDMPALPRMGEFVRIGGNPIAVVGVYHEIRQGSVEVRCDCKLREMCTAIDEDEEGWQFDGLEGNVKEEFSLELKRIRTKHR